MADKAEDKSEDVKAPEPKDEVLEALKDEGEQETPKDSSPDKQPEEAKKEPEKTEPSPAEAPKPEAKAKEEEGKPEEGKPEDKPEDKADKPSKAEERKTKLESEISELEAKKQEDEGKDKDNQEIRGLVAKRNALREEVEKKNSEVYQPATENELTDQVNPDTGKPYNSVEAKVEAMRQERELEKYNSQVVENQLTISEESDRVLREFTWANPDSPTYNKELASEAADLLDANLVKDPYTGQVIGSHVSPYKLYKTINRAHETSVTQGQIQGREDAEEMLANADSPSNAAPERKEKDPVAEILASDDY